MLKRALIGGAILLSLAGLSGAQEDVTTMAIEQQISILKQFIRQQTATRTPAEKLQVKAALLELAGEL